MFLSKDTILVIWGGRAEGGFVAASELSCAISVNGPVYFLRRRKESVARLREQAVI